MLNSKTYPIRQPKDLSLSLLTREKVLVIEGLKKRFYYPLDSIGFSYNPLEKKIWLLKSKRESKAFLGLSKILLSQALLGVLLSYRRQLNIVGIGYQAHVEDRSILVLKLGYSHMIRLDVPSSLEVVCPKPRVMVIKGMNLQRVHNFAQLIRRCRFPSSYKEKGIYFLGERLKLKQGKKT